ncbi:nucleoside-diphosphate kinase [Streptomyces sp. TS71-3]|uniref:nucleoside-diphosphate kinase n=1 Tax=Streptomyces sp. TS71-3 TaxID=2733862 RepID=UPI001B120986|nr:nucleoside-diphosphate kinase [Streptomyces sp. TS71-3]GHJ39957.1 nucleoside diphosphate kinase [Streptomyces sp. TS71-3]
MKRKPSVSGAVVDGVDWNRWSIILCKPDAQQRGLVSTILKRLTLPDVTILGRQDVTVAAWQIHVHYGDLLVDRDWFADRDIPRALDELYVGRTVTVALASGPAGISVRLRSLLGHWDPSRARPGTIRGDLGRDSHDAALTERRLVNNLVHTSDDPGAACRDFGTWYGARQSDLIVPKTAHESPTSLED